MKYALLNNKKSEPAKGARGICPLCKSDVIAKCGEIKVWHWAHFRKMECDSWWERETEWHRTWKSFFPEEWQEVIREDSKGEKHRADIMRPDGFCIEFQYSPISSDEIEARNQFYENIVWVVNGNRLDSDKQKFSRLPNNTDIDVSQAGLIVCKRWEQVPKPVFIDFEDCRQDDQRRVFYFEKNDQVSYLFEISVEDFVNLAKEGDALKAFIREAQQKLHNYASQDAKVDKVDWSQANLQGLYKREDQKTRSITRKCLQKGWHAELRFHFFKEDLVVYYDHIVIGDVFASNRASRFKCLDKKFDSSLNHIKVLLENEILGSKWIVTVCINEKGQFEHDFRTML